jgi:hypothetical protein
MRLLRVSLVLLLAIAALVALVLGGLLVWLLPQQVSAITIDGARLSFDNLGAREWLLASGGVFIATLVILLIVPLVLVIVLVVPLVAAGAVALPALIVALALLALLVWPLVWLVKRLTR